MLPWAGPVLAALLHSMSHLPARDERTAEPAALRPANNPYPEAPISPGWVQEARRGRILASRHWQRDRLTEISLSMVPVGEQGLQLVPLAPKWFGSRFPKFQESECIHPVFPTALW
jgi:hypothetical protein